MSFIAPIYFLLAGLLGVIALLYMLRLRRKERVISSTLLWQTALRDLQANSPWQRLRSNLLMWLQMAFLLLAILALVRPAIRVLAGGGQTAAIILDTSASMAATDVAPSRVERARNEARRIVASLSGRDEAMVIQAGAQTRVLASITRDKNVLTRVINNASTEDTGSNLREAITLAASLLREGGANGQSGGRSNPQIYVLSDGAVPPLQDLSVGKVAIQFVKVGQRAENLAITAMDVRRGYASGGGPQIFVNVRNYGKVPRTVNLELERNGEPVAVRPLTIPAGEQQSQLFQNVNFPDGLFTAKFDLKDDLAADNFAYARLAPAKRIRVLLLSDGNLFLEKALTIDANVELTRSTPGSFATAPKSSAASDYDVVVSDNPTAANLPNTNLLLFTTQSDQAPVEKVGEVQSPTVVDYDRKHPVAQFAPWSDVRFATAQAVKLRPWGTAIVEAERTPLVVAGERGGRRVVWCGFDLRDSDLPLRVAFPIFVTNSLRWLSAPRGARAAEGTTPRVGEGVPIDLPAGTRSVTVAGPDGRKQQSPVDSTPWLWNDGNRAGLYTVSAGDKWQQTIGLNLLSKNESDITPRDSLPVGTGKPLSAETTARSNRELWPYFALLALLILSLEWWIYHRGV